MVDFKNIKGGDPEGQAKNNSKKPEGTVKNMIQEKLDEYEYLKSGFSEHERKLIWLFYASNILEGSIEDFIINDRVEDFEHELEPTFEIATELREAIHTTIEKQMRHRFSTEELISLARKINWDA
ncbi:hypothetical protein N9C99_01005 [Gammaproteobacteria bacterium]|jgi:hypothetical protein|nr:hypothetical protein [Gammaproteobacteria bacterium]